MKTSEKKNEHITQDQQKIFKNEFGQSQQQMFKKINKTR